MMIKMEINIEITHLENYDYEDKDNNTPSNKTVLNKASSFPYPSPSPTPFLSAGGEEPELIGRVVKLFIVY